MRSCTGRAPRSLGSRLGIIGVLLAVGSGLGCAALGMGSPAVTPGPTAVKGVSPSGLELGVELQVENPNSFALVAHQVEGTLFLADHKPLGTAKAQLDQPIEAKATGTVHSQLDIPWKSAGTLRELLGKAEVPFTFEGELGVSGGPLKLSVPFEVRGRLTREQVVAAAAGAVVPLLQR